MRYIYEKRGRKYMLMLTMQAVVLTWGASSLSGQTISNTPQRDLWVTDGPVYAIAARGKSLFFAVHDHHAAQRAST